MASVRTSRSTACTCSSCGRIVDAADETCGRCGHERPEEGWAPLGISLIGELRPMVQIGAPPEEPTEDDAFEFASSDVSVPWTHEEVIPAESIEDADAPAAIPLRVRVDRVQSAAREGDALPAGLYAGRYRREETQGSPPGTTRDLAVQEPAVRRVVLTVLPPGPRTEAQDLIEARFLREAGTLARLRHPCVAQVYDFGRAPDGTCYATEEVPFGPSFGSLATARALPADRLLGITANLVGALATLHEAGLVHRCLRADAVVLAPGVWRGGEGAEIAQIGRFGLAVLPEHVPATEDADDVVVWPPEVLAGGEFDESGDLYAVGALLYHALVGRPIFAGTADQVRGASRVSAPKLPRTGERLADGLAAIAEACLAPKPEQRPASARVLLRELEVLARPVPVVVPAPVPAQLPFATLAWAAFAGALIPTAILVGVLVWRSLEEPEAKPQQTAVVVPPAPVAPVQVQPKVEPVAEPVAEPVVPPPVEVKPEVKPVVKPVAATKVAKQPAQVVPVAAAADARTEPVPVAPVEVKVEEPKVEPKVEVAKVEAPKVEPVKVEPKAPVVPGAAALSGLWLGKAPGGTLALDLVVSQSGAASGRARRTDHTGEAVVSGRVSLVEGVLRVELQLSDAAGTESYSGTVENGSLSGRIYVAGKSAGRFSAKR